MTVNAALVPVSDPAVRVAVIVLFADPANVTVTDWETSTPATKFAVAKGAPTSPALDVSVAVPVNPVAVLLFASRAVSLILKAAPAVCWGIAPPPRFQRRVVDSPGVDDKDVARSGL